MFKSGNEPALIALKQAIKDEMQDADLLLREVAVGSHTANGHAESAVRDVQKHCRTIKVAFEERLETKLGPRHPLLAWLNL